MTPCNSPESNSRSPEVVDLTEDLSFNKAANETITLDDSIVVDCAKPGATVTISDSDSNSVSKFDSGSDSDSNFELTPSNTPKYMKFSCESPQSISSETSRSHSTSRSTKLTDSSTSTNSIGSPKLTKAQARELNKKARDEAKRLRQKEKEEEKVQRQANRLNAANKALENCTTIISKSILDLIDDPEELSIKTLFDESLIGYKLTEYPKIENSVTWTYKRTEVENGQCVQKCTDSNWILVFIKGSDYLKRILVYKKDPDDLQSIRYYLSDIRRRSGSDVVLMVYGLEKHLKSERAREAKNYRKTFKDRFEGRQALGHQDEPASSSLGVTELQDLRLMLEMEFKHEHPDWKLHIEFYEKTGDIVNSLVKYSVSIAKRQVKQKAKASTGLDWALSMDKDKPSDPTKSSEHLTRLWISQLKQFSQVTIPIAKAIVADYPSPYALLDQYENLTTSEAEDLLAELYAQKNLRRQIGSNISKRIHRFMTCRDPDVHIGL